MTEIITRLTAPTPPFFQKVRNTGILLTAIASAVLSLPVEVHLCVSDIAGGMAIAGAVMAGIGQAAQKEE